jgi:hypothetical protein
VQFVQPSSDFYPWVTVAFIAWGVLDCFFGYRVFKITLAVLGGVIGAIGAQALAMAANCGPTGVSVAMLAGGALGAGLAFLLYIGAVFVAGFFFGATLGVLLLANFQHTVALLAGIVLGVVGGFVAVKVQKVLIILSTALLGSFRALLALAYFTSKLDWLYYYRQPQQIPALIDDNTWLFPSILALAAVGVIAQFGLGGGPGKKKSAPKDE